MQHGPRSGRPAANRSPEHVEDVRAALSGDRRPTVRELDLIRGFQKLLCARFGCRIFSKCLWLSYHRAGCLPDSPRLSCLVRDSCTAVSPQGLQTSLCCHLVEVIKALGALPRDSLPLARCRFFLLPLSKVFWKSACVPSLRFLLFTLCRVLPALLCHVAGIMSRFQVVFCHLVTCI